ncbi:RmlC-like cupin domain-containing protein [Thelonectria olida]|uniref:RmlC-like cupin domain-containing protein n=1 Tax=Thelonectria olida TaxID=1576542 RepID=A0A9P9ADW2_9HYPO|nr:RmlC-like cupin domain-containing protein [Thelonectria olida]
MASINQYYAKLPAQMLGHSGKTEIPPQLFWPTQLDKQVPPRPNPQAAIARWKFNELRPILLEAGDIVSAEEAERRLLMLVNPSLQAPYTTDTIYAGLQLALPGEIAPAHRHVAFALRFIVEGSGGFTAVEGDKILLQRGDVILTPSWHWHDHGNEGKDPMIWLDGLDLPLYQFARVNFAETYSEKTYPSKPTNYSKLRSPWAETQRQLDAGAGTHSIYHYRHQDGSQLPRTLGAQAECVIASSTTPWSCETTSFVYHIFEGQGYSELQQGTDSELQKIEWTRGDTFSVPAWTRIRHVNIQASGNAYLFAVSDRPIIESLGLYRQT